MQKYFEDRFCEIAARHAGENIALFFRGFLPENVRWLCSRPEAILPQADALDAQGLLDLEMIDAARRRMVARLMQEDGLVVGTYEELTAILQTVQNIGVLYSGRILVIDNNACRMYVPCCIAPQKAELLLHAYEAEKEKLDLQEELLSRYYAAVKSPDGTHFYLCPVNRHSDEHIPLEAFYPTAQPQISRGAAPESEASPELLAEEILRSGFGGGIVVTAEGAGDMARLHYDVLAGIAQAVGGTFAVALREGRPPVAAAETAPYEEILRRHWGAQAAFRPLDFYEDPAAGTLTRQISQGEIIAQIVRQSETALSGRRDYASLFITAPTGAGKSILFQIPGIYLAEKYQAVTIVVTPLIALMQDQVNQLETQRGVTCATFLNSTISHEEKEKRLAEIREGSKSILYLAPEMLVSTPLQTLLGERRVGLFVVDEAHTVTTWGRDFRADYWFLGDYLEKQRRDGMLFPVLCLTATAVYGGSEDVVQDTIATLGLQNPLLYLGSVRRRNLDFDIRPIEQTPVGRIQKFKAEYVARRIEEFVEQGRKTLVYCPFRTTVEDIYDKVPLLVRARVGKYHAGLNKLDRAAEQRSFQSGDTVVMICTKAFGMGIDVSDIQQVYHYAPTGSLADYVQEIGRCARDESIRGVAAEEWMSGDISYLSRLHHLGEIRQYQLQEILHKLYALYAEKEHRNLLVSPDAFGYLFQPKDLENKVKTSLLLLAKDLEETYGFPVLVVRPRTLFSTCYANVPAEIEAQFLGKYGDFARRLPDDTVRVIPSRNPKLASDTVTRNSGHIYEIRMGDLWEHDFSDITFPLFKQRFFSGELFSCDGFRLSARVKVHIHYTADFDAVRESLRRSMTALSDVFNTYRRESRMFTEDEFSRDVQQALGEGVLRREFAKPLLELFVTNVGENVQNSGFAEKGKFISLRRSGDGGMLKYRMMNNYGYQLLMQTFDQLLMSCVPDEEKCYQGYIPAAVGGRPNQVMRLLAVLELFGLGSCEVAGGQNLEVFVRINDPQKVRSLSESHYRNAALQEIHRRHEAAEDMMAAFLQTKMDSAQRWDLIENYFLGREEEVCSALQLPQC